MTLRDWLRQFRADENALGDLARDVAADRCFPGPVKGGDHRERYEDHLVGVHDATPAAIEALHKAWAAYQSEREPRW